LHVLALALDLRLPDCRSLKQKRAVLRPIVDGIRNRFPVAAAETGYQDRWQRAEVGIAAVSSSARVVQEVVDEVERFVWSFPEVEVLGTRRFWAEDDGPDGGHLLAYSERGAYPEREPHRESPGED
jgi:uncharacterized protein YlxP (DUF503 family)